jgi:hypothetical protein
MPDVYVCSIEPLIVIILVRVCGSASLSLPSLGVSSLDLGPLVATQAAFLFVYAVTSAEQYEAERGSARAQPARRHRAQSRTTFAYRPV